MAIETRLEELMKERGIKLIDLAEEIGLSNANLSHIKTGNIRAIRFSTLDALCEALGCDVADILVHVESESPDLRSDPQKRKGAAPSEGDGPTLSGSVQR